MNIAYDCKICKKPRIARYADDCPAEWVNKLAPMLTCDPCADTRKEYLFTLDGIGALCSKLHHIRLLRMDTTEAKQWQDKIRAGLVTMTKRYATVMARRDHLSGAVWMEDFVEQLMESPASVGPILQSYRRLLREALIAGKEAA